MKYAMKFRSLLAANVSLNGPAALIFACGLADCRYIEYSATLDFLGKLDQNDVILDIGCGHSMLPSILESQASLVCLDFNSEALDWQKRKSAQKQHRSSLEGIQASGDKLPFKDKVFSAVISISAIEHFRDEGDVLAMKEIARILKTGGICVITVPLASHEVEKADWTDGIPSIYKLLLGQRLLAMILNWFHVDRDTSYFMRRYTFQTACEKLVASSGLQLESFLTFDGTAIAKFIHRTIVPQSVVTILEYLSAKTAKVSQQAEYNGGIIMELRKVE